MQEGHNALPQATQGVLQDDKQPARKAGLAFPRASWEICKEPTLCLEWVASLFNSFFHLTNEVSFSISYPPIVISAKEKTVQASA